MARRIDTQAVIEAVRLEQQAGNPAAPAAGYWLVYFKAGGLYIEDSAGNVTGPLSTGGSVATDAIWDAKGDLAVGTGADTASKLTVGTNDTVLIAASGEATGLKYGAPPAVEYHFTIWAYLTLPSSTVGTWAQALWNDVADNIFRGDSNSYGYQNTSTDQNDEVSWKYPLSAGTYTISVWVRKSSNTAIITVLIDDVSVGTLDTYNGTAVFGMLTLTGVSISTSGLHEITLKAATKNVSSSDYALGIFGLSGTRTA